MDVLMPQLGETVAEGKISKWFVKAGDSIQPGQNLFEIETDKVSMEVPAIAAGTLAAIHVPAGDTAPVGAVVAVIQGKGETVSASAPPPSVPAKAGIQSQELASRFRGNERSLAATATPTRQMEPFREVRSPERNFGPARLPGGTVVTPLARRLAGEAGIDLANIKGSGPHGRIVAADIESVKASKPAAPALASAQTAAQVILTADVLLSASLALCAEVEAIELADIVAKAWAIALQRAAPAGNTSIAIAHGNNRAVLGNAASQSLTAIAAARRDGAADAATTSAVSIPAVPGIVSVADALQPPHTTMLSIGSPRRAPVEAPDGSVAFTEIMTVTLACDARTIDAARGAALLAAFKGFVERPVTMIV